MRLFYMTGAFYKYFNEHKEDIHITFINLTKNTLFGDNVLTAKVGFNIGDLDNFKICMNLRVRRYKEHTAITFECDLRRPKDIKKINSSKPFLLKHEYSYIINRMIWLIKELDLQDTEVGQLFIEQAPKSQYKATGAIEHKPNMKKTTSNNRMIDYGFHLHRDCVMVRFLLPATKEENFFSDLKLLESQIKQSPDTSLLSAIDRDWKLTYLLKDYDSALSIFNLNVKEEEIEELLELNFAY